MNSSFEASFQLLLRHEGGFVHNPNDLGGVTNLGVTKTYWEKYVGHPVTEADMQRLTPDVVRPFYKSRYWDAVQGDELPTGVDYCLFDACVNSGPSRAIMLLQDVLGVPVDGHLGPVTLATTRRSGANFLISGYATAHLAYLESLPGWVDFGNGWGQRVTDVEAEAKNLARTVGV